MSEVDGIVIGMDEIRGVSGINEVLARVGELRELLARLATDGTPATEPDDRRINLIAALEELTSSANAAQARATAELAASQHAQQRAAGVPADRCGRGIAAQIALARRTSPHRGGQLLGIARALSDEMPHTMRALATGAINEWRATILVRESACLSVEARTILDEEVCGDPAALTGLGVRAIAARARRVSARLDAAALVARARKAESERCVTLRPAPDQMVYLTALLPMKTGIAAYAAVKRLAEQAVATGSAAGGLGAAMADSLVHRLTGREPADPVAVQVGLVMTETALLAPAGTPGAEEPAWVEDVAMPVPAAWARELVAHACAGDRVGWGSREGPSNRDGPGGRNGLSRREEPSNSEAPPEECGAFLRRLFLDPASGGLAAMESRARTAPAGLARLIRYRDLTCATPWCDAPIRHIDHVVPAAAGGATTASNLQGLCEACNYAKQAPGWTQRPDVTKEGTRLVETRTPTGHRYVSAPSRLPGSTPATQRRRGSDPTERRLTEVQLSQTLSALELYLSAALAHPMRQ